MQAARAILDNPIAGYVVLLFFVIFGGVSLSKLPVQLTPEVQEAEIKITTNWRAATPEEIESEIIEPQEDALKGLPGVTRMLSEARRGNGTLTLTFELGFSLERALIEVLNGLNRVPSYPPDTDEPILSTTGESSRPIAWFILKTLPGNDNDISNYQYLVEELVQTRFERIRGVSQSEVRGALEQELRITIDPYKAASRNISLPESAELIGGQEDISGGTKDINKRAYNIRFLGSYDAETLGDMVLGWRDQKPVRLRDIADIELRPIDRNTFVINNGERAIAVNASRESGVNVIEVMNQLKAAVAELREGPLKRMGLSLEQVYDETLYIEDAITLLFTNLGVGLLLAIAVLWWFTRRLRVTLIVAVSIPISLFAALITLQITGRTLNTISLAALALAVGMVLDASIIAIENILRLRATGLSSSRAALKGTGQVRGALIASTATTVAVFLPILLLEGEAGQLFADLAIGLSASILVSLFAALIIVPGLSHEWLQHGTTSDHLSAVWDRWTDKIMRLTDDVRRRRALIVTLFLVPAVLSVMLVPKADYLPAGSRNLIFAYLLPPPGTNITTLEKEMGDVIAAKLAPYMVGEKTPRVSQYFFVAFPQGAFMGARAENADEADELVPVINGLFQDFPDTLAFAQRASLFSRGNTRTVELNLQSRDIEALLNAGTVAYGLIPQALPGARIRPRPGLELAEPQLLLEPNEIRIAEIGWTRRHVGMIARAVGEGLFLTDYFDGDRRFDVIVRIDDWSTPEELAAIPLATPQAQMLPLGELVSIRRIAGPDRIRRLDRRRTLTLEVIAPPETSLEDTLSILQQQIEPVLYQQLPAEATITYTGSADKLKTALSGMQGAFLLAVVILYLLISVLFRSFKDSLLVVVSLPLAAVGGILLLRGLNLFLFQPMDLLTMIGFVIVLGLVVNNAILLVHQTRAAQREGTPLTDAVRQAVNLRLRPILMSTTTSLFGMLPLLVAPGAGAELYRGLAAVIIGGLLISALFTLVLLPSLLRGVRGNRPTA